jgi:serine/threonine protein kinase/WD40 repeat protein
MNPVANPAKTIFLEAVENYEPAEWPAFLEKACAGQSELRRRVEVLLEAHREAGTATFNGAAASPPPGARERPGSVIGAYKLLEPIGEGGFGIVYLAEQQQPVRRKVALKVLKPGMDTRQVTARFEAERQALAMMDHPNIARILDGGTTPSGRPYFVMDLVKGAPITEYCDQNSLSPRERLVLFVQVCHAVQHAHQKGIIHRDLKPSNVLVTVHDVAPVVKVIDFGIAKAMAGQPLTERTLFTGMAQMLGTPMYMSPEQAGLSGLDVDTRSDIYSLGVLLYELVTGTTPFDVERLRTAGYDEMRRIIREEEPPRPSTRISTLGQAATTVCSQRKSDPKRLWQLLRGELDWIVMKALEKDRNRRYETASAFAADVQRYLHNEPVHACPPSAGYRLRKLLQRHRGPVLAVSLVVLALVGGIVGTTWAMIRAIDAEGEAVSAAQQKETALAAAQQSERHAEDRLFLALLNQARALRIGGEAGQRFDSLKALAEAARIARARGYGDEEFLKLRNEAVACLALPDLRFERVLLERIPHSYWIAFDPEFRYFVWSDLEGNLSIRRVADGAETDRLPWSHARPAWIDLTFSPDGRWLHVGYRLSGGPPQVAVWEFREGKLGRKVVLNHACTFSPDSRLVAGARPDGAIGVYELASGLEVKRLAKEFGVTGVWFHPEGHQAAVYVKSDPRVIVVLDLETGKEVTRYPLPQPREDDPAWRGDGRLLAVRCTDQRIYVLDHTERRLQSVLEGHMGLGIIVKFSHAGDFLMSTSWDGSTRLWDPVSGRQLVRQPGTGAQYVHIRGDDRQVALFREGRLELWEVAAGCECRTLHHGLVGNRTPRPDDWGPRNVDFSPDGRLLLSSSLDGARLWDLANFTEAGHLPSGPTANVLFHPDGDSLFTYGTVGLHRWPLRRERKRIPDHPDGSDVLRVGPPQPLDVPGNGDVGISLDRRGRWLAGLNHRRDRVILLDLTDPSHTLVLEQPALTGVRLTPDGRWVLTDAILNGKRTTKVWDTSDGKAVSWKPPVGERFAFFTADGRWLVTSPPGDAPLRFWQLGSWQSGPTLPNHTAKTGWLVPSPDGALLLRTGDANNPPGLVDSGTGKALATLEPPRDVGYSGQRFSPDGTRLAVCTGNHTIHVWDLRAVRRGLAEIGLDWNLAAYPPADRKDNGPIRVEVVSQPMPHKESTKGP